MQWRRVLPSSSLQSTEQNNEYQKYEVCAGVILMSCDAPDSDLIAAISKNTVGSEKGSYSFYALQYWNNQLLISVWHCCVNQALIYL